MVSERAGGKLVIIENDANAAAYGEYQAGEEVGMRAPLVSYTTEDIEPAEAFDRRDTDA